MIFFIQDRLFSQLLIILAIYRFDVTEKNAVVHENWGANKSFINRVTEGYDIALIKLPHPAVTVIEDPNGSNILPICLDWNESGVRSLL